MPWAQKRSLSSYFFLAAPAPSLEDEGEASGVVFGESSGEGNAGKEAVTLGAASSTSIAAARPEENGT